MDKMLKEVKIEDIISNSWRDFNLYPIDEEQVERLVGVIDELGFWVGIQGRPAAHGKIELACGHHRLEAAKRARKPDGTPRFKTVHVDVQHLDDEQMRKIMTSENSTQRGHNAAAIMDAVSAALRSIAKREFSTADLSNDAAVVGEFSHHRHGSTELGGGIASNDFEIGWRNVLDEVPKKTLTENEVRIALNALKQSGHYTRAVEDAIAERQRAIRKQLEHLEKMHRAKEEAERYRREEAERRRVEAEAMAEEARLARERAEVEKATHEQLRQAQAKEREQQREVKRQRELEEKQRRDAEKAEAARKKETARLRHREEQADRAKKKANKPITFDATVANLFRNETQLNQFRESVTDSIHAQYIPVNKQRQLALDIIAAASNGYDPDDEGKWRNPDENDKNRRKAKELTATYIRKCVANMIMTGSIIVRKAAKEDANIIGLSLLRDAMHKIDGGRSMLNSGIAAAVREFARGIPVPADFGVYLDELQAHLEGAMRELRRASRIDRGSKLIEGRSRHIPVQGRLS